MSSTGSSLKPIDKVSSDNLDVGFDLLTNLTYMSVLSLGSLSRDPILEHCARPRLKTAVCLRSLAQQGVSKATDFAHAPEGIPRKLRQIATRGRL